jgi:hypothetical protein
MAFFATCAFDQNRGARLLEREIRQDLKKWPGPEALAEGFAVKAGF